MFSKESRLQYTIDRNKDYYNKNLVDNKHDEYNISHTVSNDDYNNRNHHIHDHDDKIIDDHGYDDANDDHHDNNDNNYKNDNNNDDNQIRYIQHIQGVDSYMIPMNALSYQYYYHGPLHINNTIKIINYLQDHLCYESFYQDDYVASFLFDISNINMVSLRDSSSSCCYTDDSNNNYNNDNNNNNIFDDDDNQKDDNTKVLIHNIDGVSKFFYQMHMDEDVFIREYITQQCLMNNIEQFFQLITKKNVI
jgi:hypothetical protein